MAPPFSRGNDRYLYGRAIIPLASFLAACPPRWETRAAESSSSEKVGAGTWKVQQPSGKRKSEEANGEEGNEKVQGTRVSRREFWVQLFPDNNRLAERKYLKPVRGEDSVQVVVEILFLLLHGLAVGECLIRGG